MNPSSLMNPANPGSPIWIANQVAQQNARNATEAAATTATTASEDASAGDVEMACVFGFMGACCLLCTLFVSYLLYKTWKES